LARRSDISRAVKIMLALGYVTQEQVFKTQDPKRWGKYTILTLTARGKKEAERKPDVVEEQW
jgi:DNA-binding MarR family transcriptional regulator